MRKIVVNACWGGFGLSVAASERLARAGCDDDELTRDDPRLVKVVEELGNAANGRYAKLVIVEIPSDVEWIIEDYDGQEHVAEKHRVWSPPDP